MLDPRPRPGRRPLAALLAFVLAASCHSAPTRPDPASLREPSAEPVLHLPLKEGEEIAVRIPRGSIEIETSEEAAAAIVRVVEGGSPRAMQARLEHGTWVLRYEEASADRRSPVRVHATLPRHARLRVETGSGDIRVRGPLAACSARTGRGTVRLSDIHGSVDAESSSGSVEVAGSRGATITAETDRGAVRLIDVEALEVRARCGSGELWLQDVEAERLDLDPGFGSVHFVEG